jgi:beta-glucosidase
MNELKNLDFDTDFTWGCAAAAFQTEGAWKEDDKGLSIWDDFTHKRGKVKNGDHAEVACDFYHRYEEDLDLLQSMGFKNFRFSLSWSRLLPEGMGKPNQKGLDFYHRVIDACLDRDIQPWITLYHWDLPLALHDAGGWPNRDIVRWFVNYVDIATRAFGDKVKYWMVLNEPVAFVGQGYGNGLFAPGIKSVKQFIQATHHVTLCQAEGGRKIRENIPDAHIGTTFSCSEISPNSSSKRDAMAARTLDALYNRLFIEPALGMGYPIDDLKALKRIEKYMMPGDDQIMKFDFDFIGIQNYYRVVAKWSLFPPVLWAREVTARERGVPMNVMEKEEHPEGMYQMLKKFAAYPGVKKIIVTENGTCLRDQSVGGRVEDPKRIQFFKDYLEQVLRAKKEGVPVEGYFVWSLTDNFEWNEGYEPRFGLIHVDYVTQKRTIKSSGYWWKEFLSV